jgi:hypothetical protein
MLEEAFLGAVVTSACKPGQPDEQRHFRLGRLRRKVQIEFHLTSCRRGIVGELEELAAKGGYGGCGLDRHLQQLLSFTEKSLDSLKSKNSIFV